LREHEDRHREGEEGEQPGVVELDRHGDVGHDVSDGQGGSEDVEGQFEAPFATVEEDVGAASAAVDRPRPTPRTN
jgi:hypothetical protein